MTSKTNAQLEAELRNLDALLGDDYKPFPPVSDYFAYEVYERYGADARQFLLDYADILIKSGQYFTVDDTPKLREWIDAFEVAGTCNNVLLATTCAMVAHYLKCAIEGGTGSAISDVALILGLTRERYIPLWKEMEQLSYNGKYDEYLTQKMEEYKQWQN